ncbi:FR47-like protein [Fragilaria crotonensis]|nr:FR47-like protein [Fragilaria crotonensis]
MPMKGRRNVTVAPNPSWRRITMLLSIMLVQAHSWTAVPTVRKQTILQEQRTLSQLLHVAPPQQQQQLLQQRSLFALQASSCNDASSKFDSQQDEQQQQRQEFTIRNCKYADLKAVSDIIVDSFYTDNMKSSPFAAVLKLGELNRLQQNFPYNDSERHVMLVATTTDSSQDSAKPSGSNGGKIVGFVDVDARPATRRIDPPRPYLSDLAVHPDYRRNGIATILIQTCEALVHSGRVRVSAATTSVEDNSSSSKADHPTGSLKREMFIRVERENAAAIQMYEKFDYHAISHSVFGVEDTTVLLHKDFPHA